jgi:hypothetical protein
MRKEGMESVPVGAVHKHMRLNTGDGCSRRFAGEVSTGVDGALKHPCTPHQWALRLSDTCASFVPHSRPGSP